MDLGPELFAAGSAGFISVRYPPSAALMLKADVRVNDPIADMSGVLAAFPAE